MSIQITTQTQYAYQYESKNFLSAYILHQMGYKLTDHLLTLPMKNELDCLAAMHIELPFVQEKFPDLHDDSQVNLNRELRSHISLIFHDVDMLAAPGTSLSYHEEACKNLMFDYTKAWRRDKLFRQRAYDESYASLRGQIVDAMVTAGIPESTINQRMKENIIKRLPSIHENTTAWTQALEAAIQNYLADQESAWQEKCT